MGYDSVTGIHAKKILVDDKEKVALFIQIADSNLYVINENGREVMSRSWYLLRVREEWEVMGDVVRFAASCEGGMLKYKGRDVGAETLIRACRKEIKNAIVVSDLGCGLDVVDVPVIGKLGFAISKEDAANLPSYKQELFDKLVQNNKPVEIMGRFEFYFDSNSSGLKELEKYDSLSSLNMWAIGTVIGPHDLDTNKVNEVRSRFADRDKKSSIW